jgi:hypothetical protein
MRQLILVLVVLAALAFVVGAISAFSGAVIVGKAPVTYWRGAVGFLLFAITLLLMEKKA